MELIIYALNELNFHDCSVHARSDNNGIISAFDKGRSRNFEVNLSICHAAAIIASHNIKLDLEYIESSINPADPISCGILGPRNNRLELEIMLPLELSSLLLCV